MRVLVSGAGGFLGEAICRSLAQGGYTVVGAGRQPPLAGLKVSEWRTSDIADPAIDGIALCRGCDAVVHLAARTHQGHDAGESTLEAYRDINVRASVRLARAAAAAGARNFIFLSSIKVHGNQSPATAIGALARFRESDPPRPSDPYGQTKWEAEQSLTALARQTGLRLVCLRPPLVYGAGAKGNFPRLVRLVRTGIPLPLRGVQNLRSIIHVDSVADAVRAALVAELPQLCTLLLTDVDISTPDFVRAIATACNVAPKLWPCPMAVLDTLAALAPDSGLKRLIGTLIADNSEARRLLAWQPQTDLAGAMRRST